MSRDVEDDQIFKTLSFPSTNTKSDTIWGHGSYTIREFYKQSTYFFTLSLVLLPFKVLILCSDTFDVLSSSNFGSSSQTKSFMTQNLVILTSFLGSGPTPISGDRLLSPMTTYRLNLSFSRSKVLSSPFQKILLSNIILPNPLSLYSDKVSI